MQLPEYVAYCIRALEDAGFAAYAVGGCVRDDLLGIVPHDYDLCTDALPEQTAEVFADLPQDHAGRKLGMVAVHLKGKTVEITTFRQEGSYQDGRHPDWVEFVTEIRQDLARRDFTVNAIAWSPTRGYADPFDGRGDLQRGILRTVGDPDFRFQEDALRILRAMRFAARFQLAVAADTAAAMVRQVHRLDQLAHERVFAELSGFLPAANAADLARFAPQLCQVIPELAPAIGFDQHSPHHAYDVYTHTARVLQAVPGDAVLRWAALLHDIGKIPTFTRDGTGRGHFYGHALAGAEMADGVLRRLRAPNAVRDQVVFLIKHHMTRLQPEKKLLRRWLSAYGGRLLRMLLLLQKADMENKGTDEDTGSDRFASALEIVDDLEAREGRLTLKTLAVDGADLTRLGLQGREIGRCLNALLEQVLDGDLPNEHEDLLSAAKRSVSGTLTE